MVAKKKGLYLGLLLSMLAVGNAVQAYTARIKNGTPYTIKYQIDIVAGRDKTGELGPGHTAKIGIAGYSIRGVYAWVYEQPSMLDPTLARRAARKIKAKSYKAPAWKAGGGTWIVVGPIGIGNKAYYMVTREVN